MQLGFFKSFSNLYTVFYLLFGCHTANYGPLLREQPHSPYVNHCVIQVSDQRPPRALLQDWAHPSA